MGYIDKTLNPGETLLYSARHSVIIFFEFKAVFSLWIKPLIAFIGDEFGVTTRRVVWKSGIISRSTNEINLKNIESIRISQGIIGRLLGFGDIIVTGTGGSEEQFNSISNPIGFRQGINAAKENLDHAPAPVNIAVFQNPRQGQQILKSPEIIDLSETGMPGEQKRIPAAKPPPRQTPEEAVAGDPLAYDLPPEIPRPVKKIVAGKISPAPLYQREDGGNFTKGESSNGGENQLPADSGATVVPFQWPGGFKPKTPEQIVARMGELKSRVLKN